VPRLGRNIPYLTSFLRFIIVTIPASRVSNYTGLVVLRFIQGFLGGPVLATGGASAADILGFHKIPYGLIFWACAAWGGPALGPLLSGLAVTQSTWRWSMYELLILTGFTYILLFFCLPETNPETILLRRAQRLRKLTGDSKLRSQSEIKQGDLHLLKVMAQYLTTPFRITLQDPSVTFINIYSTNLWHIRKCCALDNSRVRTNRLKYSFFESFPIVYMGIYGFSIGLMGIVFISLIAACAIGAPSTSFLYGSSTSHTR
jgi:DHA1 family multidrug resistance protein-like MFS transporter